MLCGVLCLPADKWCPCVQLMQAVMTFAMVDSCFQRLCSQTHCQMDDAPCSPSHSSGNVTVHFLAQTPIQWRLQQTSFPSLLFQGKSDLFPFHNLYFCQMGSNRLAFLVVALGAFISWFFLSCTTHAACMQIYLPCFKNMLNPCSSIWGSYHLSKK